jgi:hypothetical protein
MAVQNPPVKGGYEPPVMSFSAVVPAKAGGVVLLPGCQASAMRQKLRGVSPGAQIPLTRFQQQPAFREASQQRTVARSGP